MGICRDREIRARISKRTDLCERGIHTGLVGDVEEEGAARVGRADRGAEEEDEALS